MLVKGSPCTFVSGVDIGEEGPVSLIKKRIFLVMYITTIAKCVCYWPRNIVIFGNMTKRNGCYIIVNTHIPSYFVVYHLQLAFIQECSRFLDFLVVTTYEYIYVFPAQFVVSNFVVYLPFVGDISIVYSNKYYIVFLFYGNLIQCKNVHQDHPVTSGDV